MCCDEAHRLKNNNSNLAQTLSVFDVKCKILLTGTVRQTDRQTAQRATF
jgi:SNF2 family DNA or RNA helicase